MARQQTSMTFTLLKEQEGGGVESSQNPVLIEIKFFSIQPEKREVRGIIQKMTATDRTQLRVLNRGTRPSVCDIALRKPLDALYVSDFTCVEGKSGFVVNACGIVAEFSAIVPTRNGGVMSSFQLRDVKGRCIQCMAVGRHAGSVLLQKGNEVVIFFAHATKSLSASRNGHLSVYDESHIALLRSKVPVPHARQEMQIRD